MTYTMHTFETNSSNVPAFLLKLWSIVEDSTCDDIIAWSDSGTSFIIKDYTRMSKEILQCYFKHSNMASFIRQLNMYGFRKVMNNEKSGLTSENNEMEFQHYYFTKGCIELLERIKRKIPNTKVPEPVQSNGGDILTDLSSIREKQENMDSMLVKMKQENQLLWRELTNMRKKHKAQEHVIQKVIQFLVSIVQRSNQNIGLQRKTPCMLPDSASDKEKSQVTCTIDVLNKKSNFVAVSQDKLISPLGPVIHEVIEIEPETEENPLSPSVASYKETLENSPSLFNNEKHESEYPFNTTLNNSLSTSVISEPINISTPLQPSTPALPADECTVEEFILGIPLEYINTSPSNAISIQKEESCNNIVHLSESLSDAGMSNNFNTSGMVVYTSPKSKFDDSLLSSESLHASKIQTVDIEACSPQRKKGGCGRKESEKIKTDIQQNGHSCQIAVSDSPNVLQQSTLTKNSLSNHLINIEKELNWLQDHISTGSWNVDADKLLGLFSNDNVASNETLGGENAPETNIINIKTEPSDIVEVEQDIGKNQLFQCLRRDARASTGDIDKETESENLLTAVLKQTDKITASKSAEYLLPNESFPKQKTTRRLKTQKLQKLKRQKIK